MAAQHIALFTLGGTISMTRHEDGGHMARGPMARHVLAALESFSR